MSNSVLYISYVEQLETRISDLIEERDEYDKRRRAAMELVEYWRNLYQNELSKKDDNDMLQEMIHRGVLRRDTKLFVKTYQGNQSSGSAYDLSRGRAYRDAMKRGAELLAKDEV